MKQTLLSLLLVLIVSFVTVISLFNSGFFPMHDDTQVSRVFEMGNSLSSGMFPVRWSENLGYGYGYPIFNFYAPLAYYIGSLALFIGFDALIATKWMIILGTLLAGVTMFFLGRTFKGNIGGILSALLYMYAPYHGVNIFVRGAISELFAYGFIPLIFLSLFRFSENQEKKYIILGGVGFAAVVLSHNLTALMITPFILLYMFYLLMSNSKVKGVLIKGFGLTLLLGASLSAFYWLPVIGEIGYTNVSSQIEGGSRYQDHFVCLMQLWNSPWGYGGSIPGCVDGMSFQIGKLHILFFLIATLILILRKRVETFFFVGVALLGIFFLLSLSLPLWNLLSPMSYFQFPWRFLLVISFAFSLVGGVGLAEGLALLKNPKITPFVIGGLIILLVIFNKRYFVPQTITPKSVDEYVSKEALKWKISKISDEYLPKDFSKPQNQLGVVGGKVKGSGSTQIKSIEEKVQSQSYEVTTQGSETLHFNTAYFPAWKLFINEKEVVYKIVSNGIEYTINEKGTYRVSLRFKQTPFEVAGNTISLIGVLAILLGIIQIQYVGKKKNN